MSFVGVEPRSVAIVPARSSKLTGAPALPSVSNRAVHHVADQEPEHGKRVGTGLDRRVAGRSSPRPRRAAGSADRPVRMDRRVASAIPSASWRPTRARGWCWRARSPRRRSGGGADARREAGRRADARVLRGAARDGGQQPRASVGAAGGGAFTATHAWFGWEECYSRRPILLLFDDPTVLLGHYDDAHHRRDGPPPEDAVYGDRRRGEHRQPIRSRCGRRHTAANPVVEVSELPDRLCGWRPMGRHFWLDRCEGTGRLASP